MIEEKDKELLRHVRELDAEEEISDAYQRGRADALKELMQGEPDGWVAEAAEESYRDWKAIPWTWKPIPEERDKLVFLDAFSRGISHARKGQWVKGWCALSPKGEMVEVALSRNSLLYRMSRVAASDFKKYEEMIATIEGAVNEMLQEGYRIVPAKLIKMEVSGDE